MTNFTSNQISSEDLQLAIKTLIEARYNAITQDDEFRLSSRATEVVGYIGSEAVDILRHNLKSEDNLIRWIAAEMLASIGAEANNAVSDLISVFNGENNPAIRREIIYALGAISSDAAVEALIPLLENPEINSTVINALGNTGSDAAVSSLTSILQNLQYDLDAKIRESVTKILKGTHSEITFEALIPLIDDSTVRDRFINVLEEADLNTTAESIIELLVRGPIVYRESIIYALEQVSSDATIRELISLLGDQEIREKVIYALREIGSDAAVKALIPLLSNSDINSSVIYALGEIGSDAAVKALIPLLSNSNINSSVINALGEIGSDTAINALIDNLDLGENVIEALGKSRSDAAAENLVSLLNNPEISESVIYALIKNSSDIAIEALVKILKSTNDLKSHKRIVGKILLTIKSEIFESYMSRSPIVISPLIQIFNLSHEATSALSEYIDEWLEVQQQPILDDESIVEDNVFDDEIVDEEIESTIVTMGIFYTLGEVGFDDDLALRIIKVLEHEKDPWIYDSCHAAIALGKIGSDAALKALISLLKDENVSPEIRGNAIEALGWIHPEGLEVVLRALKEGDETSRYRAAITIGCLSSDDFQSCLFLSLPQLPEGDGEEVKEEGEKQVECMRTGKNCEKNSLKSKAILKN